MKNTIKHLSLITLSTAICSLNASAMLQITVERDQAPGQGEESLFYQFNNVPINSSTDQANGIAPLIVGTFGLGSGAPARLTDGLGALNSDDPARNFFFDDGTPSPLIISLDLGFVKNIAQVNTYSWHHGNGLRAAQEFDLYGSTGLAAGFNPADPGSFGWQLLASVDTQLSGGGDANAGQHGVSISDSTGSLGAFRYIALQVYPADGFNQTFYSEIDVVAVPEPSVLGVCAIACLGMAGLRRRSVNSKGELS